jgi:serine/threonine protein kinase/tetratricopeptide (TPR) repeat protein
VALVFGKYEKIRRIAQGGMGEVFLARQTGVLDRLAILKALRTDLGKEKEFVDQFLDEARVAATLNHPNIVAIYDVGEWHGTHYIAMEYIAGEDLSRLWYAAAKAGIGLPFQVSVRIIMEAALGLDHAHRAKDVRGKPLNIVHRDISPQNIMVRADGVTKLVDFGIAKAANKASRTQAGMVKGKLQYMSPEQVRGEPLDGRSDQFSLGIVLWEMCTGRRLFKADNEINTLQKILQNPIPKPSQHVPGFPAELEAVIMKMLERDINRRFASLGDVAVKLKEYLDRSSVSVGEVSVAAFVQQILGKELEARIADLTPMEPTEAGVSAPPKPAPKPAPAPVSAASKPIPKAPAKPTQADVDDDDRDAPTAIVAPENRPDRRPPPPTEDGLAALPDGPTGEWVVRRADGSVVHFQAWATLQQWVLDGKLHRDDAISADGRRFTALGDEPQLFDFFATADAARARPVVDAGPTVPDGKGQRSTMVLNTTVEGQAIAASLHETKTPVAQPGPLPPPAKPSTPPRSPTPPTPPPSVLDDAPPAPPGDALDPFAPAPTEAFSLGALPSTQTGAWQLGTDFQSLQAAAIAAQQPSVSGLPTTTSPTAAPPSTAKAHVPTALWAALGVVGTIVLVGMVLRVAAPDTLAAVLGGERGPSSARARAALTAIATDEPATVAALRASLDPLLTPDADADILVAGLLLDAEKARVLTVAGALQERAGQPPVTVDTAGVASLAARLKSHADAGAPWSRYALAVADVVAGADPGAIAAVADDSDPTLRADAASTATLWRIARALSAAAPGELQALVASGDDTDRRLAGARAIVAAIAAADDDARATARRALLTRQQKAPSDPRLGPALALLDAPGGASKPPEKTPEKTPEKAPEKTQEKVTKEPPEPPPPPAPAPEPETYDSALAKGTKAQKAGRSKEAVKLLTTALELKPGDASATLALAWAQLDLGRNEAAAKNFRAALTAKPSLVEAQFGLGEALRAQGKTTEAIEAFQKYLELAPAGPDAETAKNAIRALE